MTIVRRLAVCIAYLLVLAPGLVLALELGPIEARSALYEPLDARIPVHGATSGDLEGLNVVLGSPAQFELARVVRLPHLDLLEFIVVDRGGGDGYIHVRTEEPIIEPSLTFLVDVDWPRGRTVRGYRLRLTPAVGRAAGAGRSRPTTPQARPAAETSPSDATPDSPPASSGIDYGPVRKAETLWSIAARLRPDPSVSVQRMMLAIVEANPEAFVVGNVNGLTAGTTLRIPGRDEIGPDNLPAALAEVRRQYSAWSEYREGARAPPTPTDSPAPSPRDSETEPSGRIEVVSPETATGVTGQEEGADVEALRKELALATEQADAGRRENDELKLRLAEAEDHVTELLRLVDLKNEEIAALQVELRTLSETTPKSAPTPVEAETTQVPAPSVDEPEPVMTPAKEAPRSLPFGLGTLPVNPVFLVGGAGMLLLLLGVLALLRRRSGSVEEDDTQEVAEASQPEEDNLLLELEAVAAELADERGGPPDRHSRAGLATVPAVGVKSESPNSDAVPSEPEEIAQERAAKSWQDDRATERLLRAKAEANDDATEMSFDIDAVTGDESDFYDSDLEDSSWRNARGERSDGVDVDDFAEPAGLVADWEANRNRAADEAAGGFDLLFTRQEAEADDSDIPGLAPVADAGDLSGHDAEFPDDGRNDWLLADPDDQVRVDSESGSVGSPDDDSDNPVSTLHTLLDESTDGGETDALSLEDFGEDDVQTRIDLAQVYMEMGDTESARGFLEAVLAEGDAAQQDTAREMLSKLA